MKLITWNCCLPPWVFDHKKRRKLIASEIINIKPDIICLQEVFYKSDVNFLIKQFNENGLDNHFYFKNLLISSKIKILEKKGFVFKNQGNMFSSAFFDVVYKKGFQKILLENNISVINTHLLSSCGSIKEKAQIFRQKQSEEISQAINNNKNIIVGDFNFISNTKPYMVFLNKGFKECFKESIKTHGDRKLDHVFTKGLKYINRGVIFKDNLCSDHKGLLIEI